MWPALIAAGAQIAGTALTASSQGRMNRKTMRFQKEMFDRTNAYNAPIEQRRRLEAAGLNPNLVYGQSSGGAAGQANAPAQPDLKAVDYTTPGQSIGNSISQAMQWKSAQSAIDVNTARTENLKQDSINKGIEAVNAALRAGSGSIDLRTKNRLYDNTIKTAEERLRNLSVNTNYTSDKNSREERITAETVQKLQQETANLRTQGRTLSHEEVIKKIDKQLYQDYGLKPQDPYYMRILHNILEKLELNPFKQ